MKGIQMADIPKLHSSDKALLRAAQTGEGAVELTAERLEAMCGALEERSRDIAANFPKLVDDCPYETRLAVAAWVFEAIVKHAEEGGSFRYLIYERLGFDADAYVPLYLAGGLTISNEVTECLRWRPIAEAPKDGSRVLCWAPGWEPCFLIWKLNPRITDMRSLPGDANIETHPQAYFGDPLEMDDYELAAQGHGPTLYMPLPLPPEDTP
jgi:hypothetical protein